MSVVGFASREPQSQEEHVSSQRGFVHMLNVVLVNQCWTGSLTKRYIVLSPPQLWVSPTASAAKERSTFINHTGMVLI